MAKGSANKPSVVVVPAPGDLARVAERTLEALVKTGDRLCVGLSGGIDSMVLLDVIVALAPRRRWRVSAIHVNHQLSPNAPVWAAFCRRACRAHGVPLRVVKVEVTRGERGKGSEAAARAARYDAYRACRADHMLLAHNQDDQVETLLLRLLRGAGVKGLAAMPLARADGDLHVVRPLLDVSRREIERYARRRKLEWVDDESNADTYFLRNFLRGEILPRIEPRVPGYRATLTRAAAHFAEAAALLDEMALLDAQGGMQGDALGVDGLRRLPAARARNLLRHFLANKGISMPDKRTLDEALRQAISAKQDARVRINLGSHTLHRFDGALHLVPALDAPDPGFSATWEGERSLRIVALGATLKMVLSRGTGIDLERLRELPVTLRLRRGGERLRPDAARPRRQVKDLFQEQGVPPWLRERIPFLWSGRHLVWVPGLGVDQRYHPLEGARSVVPRWQWDSVLAPAGNKARKAL